ncbi:unnamed protein product [Sphagnum jensenii]|uniref:Uncharacterized protein n=1 Tax=Sphagnum jensenii TaxID=128206 RepID=A0ABP1BLY1_9BRYO
MEPPHKNSVVSSQGDYCLSFSNTAGQHSRQSSISYGGRPPSAQSSIRPSTCRSGRSSSIRPGTPGGGIGLNTELKVENRPVAQQGMISVHTSLQGPGRQVLDKSYYMSRLRSKKQELQSEINSMSDEIERMQRRGPAAFQLEQKQESLSEEVKALKVQLGDYNVVMEKITAGIGFLQLKELLRLAREKSDNERKNIDQLFQECTVKEQGTRDAEGKLQTLEVEMGHRISQEAPERKEQYTELQGEARELAAAMECMEMQLQQIAEHAVPLEQDLAKATPSKQTAVALVEQLLRAEEELQHLKIEDSATVHLSPEEARSTMLSKIRQDNAEIAKAEEKCKELEADIRVYGEKCDVADKSLAELKGGRAEKFLEMQQKEKKMQAFIDNFEAMHSEHETAAQSIQQNIVHLQECVSHEKGTEEATNGKGGGFKSSELSDHEMGDIDELLQVMEEQRGELKQLEEMKVKTANEVCSIKEKIATLEAENYRLGRLDELRAKSEMKCEKLEADKIRLDEKRMFLQVQLKEQTAKMESIQNVLSESEMHAKLEHLNQSLLSIQQTVTTLQEEVEMKEQQANYHPVLENIRFMVAQLNTDIKACNLH